MTTTPLREAHDATTNSSLTNEGGTSVPIDAGTVDRHPSLDDADVEMTDADLIVSEQIISTPLPEAEPDAPVIRVVPCSGQTSMNDSLIRSSIEGGSGRSEDSVGESKEQQPVESVDTESAVEAVAEKASQINIRIDEATGNVCIVDALRALDPLDFAGRKANNVCSHVQKKYGDLREGTTIMQFHGKGFATVAAQPLLLCEIAYLAVKDRPDNRREALVKICEFLSVDVAWIAKWETKYSNYINKSSGKILSSSSKHDAHVRVDVNAKVGCIIDTLRFVDPAQFSRDDGSAGWRRLHNAYPHLNAKVVKTNFGRGLIAGAAYASLAEIGWYWMSLQQHTPEKRRETITKLCEKANVQPTSTTSSGKRKAAALESDQEAGSSIIDSTIHSIDKNSASVDNDGSRSKGSCFSISGGRVYVVSEFELRIDKASKLGSVSDVINNVLSRDMDVSTAEQRRELASEYPVLNESIKLLVCNGQGEAIP